MRGIINAVKGLLVLAGGVDNDIIKSKKKHIKKKYPFSSERQHARYRCQIANGQITKSNGLSA